MANFTATGSPSQVRKAESIAQSDRRWWILAIVTLAQLVVILDATVVSIALPTAQAALGFSNDARQWVVVGYSLTFGSLLLIGGRLCDLVGRRTMFLIGVCGFGLASLVGGAAPGIGVLIAGRVGQGVFGAMLAPAALSLLSVTFPGGADRGRAFALFGGLSSAGGAIGLVVGGSLTQYLSWRWCLYANAPIEVAIVVATLVIVPRQPRSGATPRFDVAGSMLSAGGLFCLVYGLANANTEGWSAPSTLSFIVIGLALLAAFVAVELKVADPLFPMGVLDDRTRAGSFLAVLLGSAGVFGIYLFLIYYLTSALRYKPLPTGFAFLPLVFSLAAGAQIARVLLVRLGLRVTIVSGFTVAAAGLLFLTRLSVASSYPGGVLPGMLVAGLGAGMIFAPAYNNATAGIDTNDAGTASAGVNMFQQVGGSLAIAVLSAVAASKVTASLAHAGSAGVSAHLKASISGYTAAFFWAAVIFGVGAVVCALVIPGRAPAEADA